jgi:hypothetical protein
MLNRTLSLSVLAAVALGAAFTAACGSTRSSGFNDNNGSGGTDPGSNQAFGGPDGGASVATKQCNPDPKNYDIPGNNCDDDGDGKIDNPPTCDGDLSTDGSAEDFAKSLGICTKATDKGYGLVSATYTTGYQQTQPDPKDEQHGILKKFGNKITPREGGSLGVLSSGYAREYDGDDGTPFGGTTLVNVLGHKVPMPNGKDWWNYALTGDSVGKLPPGFPKAASGCKQANVVNDVVSIKLELKAPPNVSGIQFDFNFYSGEWPAYICSPFNDGFLALLTAKGFNNGQADNVSFDKDNNPVSVNNGFFDRCTPNTTTGCGEDSKLGKSTCPGGTEELAGTGFGVEGKWCSLLKDGANDESTSGGATGWLTSHAPVQPGETFTIEFMVWDTGDAMLDSSVLLDKFTWIEGEAPASTERPVK